MNRHGKFYAELEAELNDDDDYYDDDDDNAYYEEEEEYNGDAYNDEDAREVTTTAPTTTTSKDYNNNNNSSSGNSHGGSAVTSSVHVTDANSTATNTTTMTTARTLSAAAVAAGGGGRTLKIGGGGGGGGRSGATAAAAATTTTATASETSAVQQPQSHAASTKDTTTPSSSPLTAALTTTTTTAADDNKGGGGRQRTRPSGGDGAGRGLNTGGDRHETHKQQCTLVVAGHVDAGKSTTLGHLLLLLGRVAAAEVERNEREGRQSHKESFKYAWLLDQSEEERRRGVTIDAGSFVFDTPHRRVHVLDAPGHKEFVLSMISSATLADAALLVVTAAPSEFETGLAHGTREHLLVLKTLGVGSIVVAVNKMDMVDYAEERYAYVVHELQQLLRQMRIKESVVTGYCPVSGMTGANLVARVDVPALSSWYTGPTLLELLDCCPLESRLVQAPLRVSVRDVQGNTLYGKIESGTLRRGETVLCVPGNVRVVARGVRSPTVASVGAAHDNNNSSNYGGGGVDVAVAGDTVEVTSSTPIIGVVPGCVACALAKPLAVSTDVEAHVQTFATLTRSILPGATFTMVVHALTVPVKVIALVSLRSGKTGEWSRGMVKAVPPSTQAIVLLRAETAMAVEAAETCRALGRFVLRQDGETVAGGLVKRVVPVMHAAAASS